MGTYQIASAVVLLSLALFAGSPALLAGPAKVLSDHSGMPPAPVRAADLVRSTLASLNEANLTANYSVLRDGGAPEFRRDVTEEKLAAVFEVLRDQGVNLSAFIGTEPQIDNATYITARHVVVYRGAIVAKSQPFAVNFKIAYQFDEGRWRLFMLELGLDADLPHLRGVGTAL